jgi:hypothetical protein
MKYINENQSRNDAALFAEISSHEAAIAASHQARIEAAIAAGGPIPDGWEFESSIVEDLPRWARRVGAVPAIIGWSARKPHTVGDRVGHLRMSSRSGTRTENGFEESAQSRDLRLEALTAMADAAEKRDITDTVISDYGSRGDYGFVVAQEAVVDGVVIARRRSNGTGGFYGWEFGY